MCPVRKAWNKRVGYGLVKHLPSILKAQSSLISTTFLPCTLHHPPPKKEKTSVVILICTERSLGVVLIPECFSTSTHSPICFPQDI